MNSSTYTPKFEPTSQQSPMNNFGTYYRQVRGYTDYQFHPQYNNQYSIILNPMCNFNSPGCYGNNFQSSTDSSINVIQNTKTKRESKPLTIFDPNRNEILDLKKISQPKSNSLLNEIQHPNNCQSSTLNSSKDVQKVENEVIVTINEVIINEPIVPTEKTIITEICTENFLKSFSPIKPSYSIPNKLDNLSENSINQQISSSETNLHQKLNSLLNDFQNISNNKRKTYKRGLLVEIGKSERSQTLPHSLENFECKEILIPTATDFATLLENKFTLNGRKGNHLVSSPLPLSRITNGYMPPHLRLKEECILNKNLENCRRNLKSILNKIAPQNFNLCMTEIKSIIKSSDQQDVPIKDCIDCLIEEIFDKAIKEETYSVTYANLCNQIAKFDDENDSKWSFKSSLLNRCKKMFETPLQEQLKFVKEHWEKKIEDESDPKLKNLYRSDIDEQVKKERDKYFGNIRFIGELYVQDLLKPKIIHSCVMSLITKSFDEDAMLSLCKLIETCGKKFDEKHHDRMSDYIKTMNEMVENEQMETRIRFRILDIVEMSERNWSLRKIQAQKMIRPKTLEEVKNDDSEDLANAVSKFSTSKQHNRSINVKLNQNSNELRFKQSTIRNNSINVNSLTVMQNEKFDLKPCSYGRWKYGSKENDFDEWTNVDNKKKGKNSQLFMKIPASFCNKSAPLSKLLDDSAKLITKSKFSALISEEDIFDNGLVSLNSPNRETSIIQKKIDDDDDDIVVMDGDELFDNLLNTKILNLTAWESQNDVSELITSWLDRLMEKDKLVRNLVGDVLANLFANEKLSKEKLIEGLIQFIEIIDDLITDVPKIWSLFAEVLERFFQNSHSCIDFYGTIFENRLPNKGVSECVIMALKYANERLGNDVVKELVENQLQSLKNLIFNQNDNILSSLIESSNLTFLRNSDIIQCSLQDKFSDIFKVELTAYMSNDVENILALLDSKFSLEEMQTAGFVFNVACCIFSFINDLSTEKDIINFLVEKQLFFMRLIGLRAQFEIQILFALVNFAVSLENKGFLLTVVNNLSGKISTDAFVHFMEPSSSSKDFKYNNTENEILFKTIRSTLDKDQR